MNIHTDIQRIDNIGASRVTINNNFQIMENYMRDLINTISWQNSVIDFEIEGSAIETEGNRYIADADGATWSKGNIYQWSGSEWLEYEPQNGWALWIENPDYYYIFSTQTWDSLWVKLGNSVDHNLMQGLQGGNSSERYHLSTVEKNLLTTGVSAHSIHFHNMYTSVPVDESSSGAKGQWAYDDDYMYYCKATNEWVRWAVEFVFPISSSSSSTI